MRRDPAEQADLFATWVSRTGLSVNTKSIYTARVRQFTDFLAKGGAQYDGALSDEYVRDYAVRDWRRVLLTVHKLAPATVQQHMSAVGQFYDWLELGRPTGMGVPIHPPAREGLTEDELRRYMRAGRARGPRDYALLAVLAYAGLRRAEAHALDVDDVAITERAGRLQVRAGKGDKPRTVPIGVHCREALSTWLIARPGERDRGPLWVSRTGSRLSVRSIGEIVTDTGTAVGLDVSPHRLRHTYGRRSVRGGTDPAALQQLMGHASVQTTMGYSNPSVADLESAAERVGVDL